MNTHTYAVIEIDRSAFLEIIHRLAIAGHPTDCLHDDLIDMYGIALKACAPPAIVAETDGIEILSDGTVLGTPERVEEFRQFVAARGKLLDRAAGATCPVLRFSALVYPDHVHFETHSRDTTWYRELRALESLQVEITRIINDGPMRCPAAPERVKPAGRKHHEITERLTKLCNPISQCTHASVVQPVVDQIGFPVVEPSRELIDERYGFKNVKRDGDTITGELVVDFGSADLHLPATVEFKQKEQAINVGMDIGLTHDRIADGLSAPVLPVTDDHEMACKCSRHSVTHWIEAGCPQLSIRVHTTRDAV